MSSNRIIVADPNVMVRYGLSRLFEGRNYDFVDSDNGSNLMRIVSDNLPGILLVEFDLPEKNGATLIDEVKKVNPHLKPIIYTLRHEKSIVKRARLSDVEGYVLKSSPTATLLDAIETVKSGKKYLDSNISGQLWGNIKENEIKLTPREIDVLIEIALGKPNKLVAIDLELSIKTVEKHRVSLMRKLGIHDVVSLLKYAMREGYVRL